MPTIRQLHTIFSPKAYKLELTLDRVGRSFYGAVVIIGRLQKEGSEILLHAKSLHISKATIDDRSVTTTLEPKTDELTLRSQQLITAGDHEIRLEFSGTITDAMHGLYPCYFKLDGKDQELVVTQFETHHAREVFPCIDEPAAKAAFDLTLYTESDVTVIANTPVKTQQTTETKKLATTFETTPVMSTYLLAWVVGKLKYVEAKTKAGVLVRVYTTPDKVTQTKFALNVTTKTLELFNDYFDTAYPLAKCDLVALPDFSAGAMENWGCITFRESCLLVDEAHTPTDRKQYISNVIAHELAHQWFGNLVTMQWWDDLWLNESFATWAAYLACDNLSPDWQMWTQFFTNETMKAYQRDSLGSVQRVQQTVGDPDEIQTLFDGAIVYAKGASLLHMLHSHIGSKAFRRGLRVYLQRHQYGSTITNDLWQALSEASGKNVAGFMQPWLIQPGYPVIKIAMAGDQASIEQQRFYGNPKATLSEDPTLWPVPLLSNGALEIELLDTKTNKIQYTNSQSPLRLNQGRSGFYLSSYSAEHLAKLSIEISHKKLPIIDRLGLLNDSLSLSSAGHQSTLQMLQLLEAYRGETSQTVWVAISEQFNALKILVKDRPDVKPALRQFIATFVRSEYERLGWETLKDEPYQDTLLRPNILGLMCYSQEPEAIQQTKNLFNQATEPEEVPGDLRSIVFATAMKHGGSAEFAKLLDWYKTTASAEDRISLTAGLGNASQPELIGQAIKLLTTDVVKPQDIFLWFGRLIKNRHARTTTWQWMQTNWQWITNTFGSDMNYTAFPRYSAAAFSTLEHLAQYRQFFEPLLRVPSLERTIRQGLEEIESRALWRKRDLDSVANYLSQKT